MWPNDRRALVSVVRQLRKGIKWAFRRPERRLGIAVCVTLLAVLGALLLTPGRPVALARSSTHSPRVSPSPTVSAPVPSTTTTTLPPAPPPSSSIPPAPASVPATPQATSPPSLAPLSGPPDANCPPDVFTGSGVTCAQWAGAQAWAESPVVECIRQHESGGDYSTNTGNGYSGAYQDMPGTWNGAADAAGLGSYAIGEAYLAPPIVQDVVNYQVFLSGGWGQWSTAAGCGA